MTRTPLPHDFGPMWREHNRRQHVPFWEKQDRRFVWLCIFACCAIFAIIAATHTAVADYFEQGNTLYPSRTSIVAHTEDRR